MSEAPEKIMTWVWKLPYPSKSEGKAEWNADIYPAEQTCTAYIRSDLCVTRSDLDAAVALALEGAADCRKWFHYPLPMPVTADGRGPATVGVDAVRITYEVWDALLCSHASFDTLPDAINEAMRLNAARAALAEYEARG